MMKNANLLALLKVLKIPVENELTFNLDYAAQHLWQKKVQNFYNNLNDENRIRLSKLHSTLGRTSNIDDELIKPTNNDFWVFGYGSLIWKADFPYIDKKKGFIRGFQRRFYQESIDHRGTRDQPGRVVTLLPSENEYDRVYGVAYRIPSQIKNDVIKHLDYREKNGYERVRLQFHVYPENQEENFDLVMYIASKDNASYAGEIWEIEDIAKQILVSAGPSGANRDYLFSLANSMRILFPDVEDSHLYELEARVTEIIEEEETKLLKKAIENELEKFLEVSEINEQKAESVVNKIVTTFQEKGGREMYLRQVVSFKQNNKHFS